MRCLISACLAALSTLLITLPADAASSHAIAMHGEPALPADFDHFPYADPNAPKGGRIDYAWVGTFDSLNPFIVQGDAPRGMWDMTFGNNVFEPLMQRSRDEAFTLYPLLAQSVETDDDRTFVEFTLNPRAKFSDGAPVTPDDVIFSLELLRDKGRPLYKNWVDVVAKMEKVGERGVRLTFNEKAGRESALLLAQLPILPKHATDAENFDKSTLKPMIGSGPYRIDSVRPGEVVVLKRNPDYWGNDIPSKRGFDNFDEIRMNYFRDENTMFEAFKKGAVDIQLETDTGRWTSGYNFPAATDGRIAKETFKDGLPSGMYGFVLNTRRDVFKNRDVRVALAGLFDFEWANKNLFSGAYQRIKSYYDGSDLSSYGHPASDAEKALLGPHAEKVLPEIMAGTWTPPISDGSGRDRTFLKKGFDALVKAGYKLNGETMVGPDGKPLGFEILLNGKGGEAVAAAWQRTLAKLGIRVTLRPVDSAQYLQRQRVYDFDAMLMTYTSSLSPGTEQLFRWGSASRDSDGTYNFAGVADPAIDAMIDQLLKARTEDEFVTAVRAYDRLLLSGAYVVPLYYQPDQWVGRWTRIKHPENTPIYGYQLPAWWRGDK
ncbi:extracellular solute-binding protein [Mesorhizobium sp. BAC0120]|nr:extracellular solute-binding protein [Mesorhizobium sp. BAC0120]MDW6023035.1 extracellular solute-binding protein [Mesorhizobium sp. BAC0120]